MYAAIAMQVVGTAIKTMSDLKQQDAQQKTLETQALQTDYQAQAATDAATYDENALRYRAERVLASNRASGAAGGLDISSDSPLLMDLENTRQAEINALNIRRSGQIQSQMFLYQGKLYRRQASAIGDQKPWTILSDLMPQGAGMGSLMQSGGGLNMGGGGAGAGAAGAGAGASSAFSMGGTSAMGAM